MKEIMNIKDLILKATPGLNYAVISDNYKEVDSIGLRSKYTYKDGSLCEDIEENSLDTIYDLASLTKVVCTLPIIFRFYERGIINLNDKVCKYLKDFKYKDITISDLLTHTSGLCADFKSKDIITKEEALKKVYDAKIVEKKGTYLYSDIGYILLGLIIEKVSNKKLDEVFKEEVAIPLNMKNTCFNPTNKEIIAPTEITFKRGIVRGIVHDEKACSLGGIAGHAGLFSNIEDMCNYVSMILNNGDNYLSKETIDKWFTPISLKNGYYRSYCFFVGDNPNVICNENTISFNGFTGPSISIDRDKNIAIVMLANRIHPKRDNTLLSDVRILLSKKIYNIMKGKCYEYKNRHQ